MTPKSTATSKPTSPIHWRTAVRVADSAAVGRVATATEFFSSEEVAVAVELVDTRLAQGAASGYDFVLADIDGELAGYTCFGPIPATAASYDLYWIIVDPRHQGRGLGRMLLERSEEAIRAAGGRRVYIETSSRPQYEPTRGFYLRTGYTQAALLDDFYAPGDGKLIYVRAIGARTLTAV